jgi:hypothetical protein
MTPSPHTRGDEPSPPPTCVADAGPPAAGPPLLAGMFGDAASGEAPATLEAMLAAGDVEGWRTAAREWLHQAGP